MFLLYFFDHQQVRATPWGAIAGWRLLPNGRRSRGSIFSFKVDHCSAAVSLPGTGTAARALTSARLARGGLFLATAAEGHVPSLWDVRLARRRPPRSSSDGGGTKTQPAQGRGCHGPEQGGWSSSGAAGSSSSGYSSATRSTDGATQGAGRWGLASLDFAEPELLQLEGERDSGRPERGHGSPAEESHRRDGRRPRARRPRCVSVRPWPPGVWAVGVAVEAGSGRLVSACSDGRLRCEI